MIPRDDDARRVQDVLRAIRHAERERAEPEQPRRRCRGAWKRRPVDFSAKPDEERR